MKGPSPWGGVAVAVAVASAGVSILCLLCDTWHIQQPCVLYGTSIYTYRMSSYSNGGYTESTHNHAGLAKKVSVVHHQATPASAEVESARKEQA